MPQSDYDIAATASIQAGSANHKVAQLARDMARLFEQFGAHCSTVAAQLVIINERLEKVEQLAERLAELHR